MESEKENLRKLTTTTRIPIPVQPLPALPNHLLRRKYTLRQPLGTISQADDNASSSSDVRKNNERRDDNEERVLKIDARHVTGRQKDEYVDSAHNVFKDFDENLITFSDDDLQETKENPVAKDVLHLFSEGHLGVTPAVPIEHKGVLHIKKELRRPHSRELQGVSNAVDKGKNKEKKVKRKLQFNIKINERLESSDFWITSYMTCMTRDYTNDIFEHLLNIEKKPLGSSESSSILRACIINWLMKVNGSDGNPATIQSACWYLDSILNISIVPIENVQLVAAACYWIAQKLHGRPVISSKELAKASRNAFTAQKLVTAEKTVLLKLEFPIQPIVPQDFITYLSWWCDRAHSGPIEVAATFLCMSALMVEKIFCDEFPSVIAALAVRNALLLMGKGDLLDRLELCPVYQKAQKKTSSMMYVSAILRRAVRTISSPLYEYKTPLDHYGGLPHYTNYSTSRLADLDTRNVNMDRRYKFGK